MDHRTLRAHVLASNAIEGIRTRSGPLYFQHLQASRAVAADPQRYVYDLPRIHRLLFAGQSRPRQIGRHRLCAVLMVGQHTRHHLPPARDVPALMRAYYALVEQALVDPDPRSIWAMHAVSLCIHPFTDGNGRATRLHLNALRLSAGYEWFVVEPRMRGVYYQYIRDCEQQFFPAFQEFALRCSA